MAYKVCLNLFLDRYVLRIFCLIYLLWATLWVQMWTRFYKKIQRRSATLPSNLGNLLDWGCVTSFSHPDYLIFDFAEFFQMFNLYSFFEDLSSDGSHIFFYCLWRAEDSPGPVKVSTTSGSFFALKTFSSHPYSECLCEALLCVVLCQLS